MKLKFYLRGIGIGIIVTVAICICAGNGKKEKMTDAQIRARAIELGMVDEGSVIADTLSADSDTGIVKPEIEPIEEADTNTDTDTETEASALEEITTTNDDDIDIESSEDLDQSKEELTEQTEASDKPDAKEEKLKEPVDISSKEMVTITVEKGNGSDTVARKLKEAGLVDDAVAYDKWLIENGYDRRISAGSHSIPVGASKEEIARIISGG